MATTSEFFCAALDDVPHVVQLLRAAQGQSRRRLIVGFLAQPAITPG
jgi:hypothetical protein